MTGFEGAAVIRGEEDWLGFLFMRGMFVYVCVVWVSANVFD